MQSSCFIPFKISEYSEKKLSNPSEMLYETEWSSENVL